MKLIQAKQGMLGGLGDALSEAMAAERTKVNDEAADYKLPRAARTRSQAIMALILLMRAAAVEDAGNAGYYKRVANEAAYKYRSSSIGNILKTAVDLTKDVKRTGQLARDTYAASGGSASTGQPRKPTRSASRGTPRTEPAPLPPESTEVTTTSWTDSIPSWAPWVGGGVLLLLTAAVALRRSS